MSHAEPVVGEGAARDELQHVVDPSLGHQVAHPRLRDKRGCVGGFVRGVVAEVGFSKQNLKGLTSCLGFNS